MKLKKKKVILGLFMILFIIAVGSAAYLNIKGKQEIQYLTYNQFLQQINRGNIDTLYLIDDAKLEGKLKNGEKFETDNPRTENFKEMLLKNNVKVEERNQNTTITSLLGIVGFVAIFGGMGIFLSRQSSQQASREISRMSNIDVSEQNQSAITFADVAGNAEAKESVADLVDFLRNPNKYSKYGARIPRGVILYGPPGTGKTLLAKALAGESGVPFYAVSGSDFVQIYAGLGAGRIRSLFKKAREKGKCVIFIDEIDALGKKRDGINGSDEADRTLNALLTEMSGFHDNDGIIVIAATNRLDILDEALLRPGRFDRQIEVGLPDLNARYEILKLHSSSKPLSEDIDLKTLAQQTVYFSGARLENMLNEAAILAAKENSPQIELKHIDKAFYTVIAGEEKKDRSSISLMDKKITAYHEAGHALVTKLIAPEYKVSKVTIIPSTRGAGGFSMSIPPDRLYQTKREMICSIKIALAGRAAEQIVFGEEQITTGASNDIERATETLILMLRRFGMNNKAGLINYDVLQKGKTFSMERDILRESKRLMAELYHDTKDILQKNISVLEAFAQELLLKETLNEKEIDRLFKETIETAS